MGDELFLGCSRVLFLPSSFRLVAVFQLYSVKRHRLRECNDDVSINMHLSSVYSKWILTSSVDNSSSSLYSFMSGMLR